jgi:hypothetical protein
MGGGQSTSYVFLPVPSAPQVITNTAYNTQYVDRYVESDYQKYVDQYNLTHTTGIPIQTLIQDQIEPLENKFIYLQTLITDGYNQYMDLYYNKGSKQNKVFQKLSKTMEKMDKETKKYDVLFEEEEAKRQAFGGRSRHQTLQEFVILFFYTSFLIFTISICIHEYRNSQNFGSTIKTFVLMMSILLVTTVCMIRYG